MRLRVREIEESPKELAFDEPTGELNPLLTHGPVRDFTFASPATVHLSYYRSGEEIFLQGEVHATVVGQCARCLEEFAFRHAPHFTFILVPHHGRWARADVEASGDLTWYEGEEIDTTPLLRERLLLTLPTLPLCGEDCRGLCARCGANLNTGSCGCVAEPDPRLAILRSLKTGA